MRRRGHNVWAVGYSSDGSGSPEQTLTEHWDGTSWSVVPSPDPGVTINDLESVVASPEMGTVAWAVGSRDTAHGRVRTLTMRWGGSGWAVVRSANPSTKGDFFAGIDDTSTALANQLWAVGASRVPHYDSHTLAESHCCRHF